MARLRIQTLARLLTVFSLAGLVSGCLMPLYGDSAATGSLSIVDKMRSVEVGPIKTGAGIRVLGGNDRLPRVGGEVRNALMYALTGGGEANTSDYRLNISLSATSQQVIADIPSGRADAQNYNISARYELIEVGTGRRVVLGSSFAKVSYDLPGQQQRFSGARALRDAENRAADIIADSIHSRLASYFFAGT